MKETSKKALWIPEELHKDIKVFAITNNMNIESATQLLLKLGMVSYKENKAVLKRREELEAERLDKSIKMYYFQKGAGEHYREIQYESGRVVRTDFND